VRGKTRKGKKQGSKDETSGTKRFLCEKIRELKKDFSEKKPQREEKIRRKTPNEGKKPAAWLKKLKGGRKGSGEKNQKRRREGREGAAQMEGAKKKKLTCPFLGHWRGKSKPAWRGA